MAALLLALLLCQADELKAYESAVQKADWQAVARLSKAIAAQETREAADFLEDELGKAARQEHRRALFRARALMRIEGQKEFLLDRSGDRDAYFRATALEALTALDPGLSRKRAIALVEADPDGRVRRAAVEVLGRLKAPGVGLALVRAAANLPPLEQAAIMKAVHRFEPMELIGIDELASDGDPGLRLTAILALSGVAAEHYRSLFEKARKDIDRGVAIAASAALDRIRTPGRSPYVRQVLSKVSRYDERFELFDLVSRMRLKDPALYDLVARSATTGKKLLRPKAAETLGHLDGEAAVEVLAPLAVKGSSWQLRVGAARGLAATRRPQAIDALIAGLGRARGRVAHEHAAALEALTGQRFGLNAEMWSFWWERHKEGYRVPDELSVAWGEHRKESDRYAFYGIEIRSEAMAFLLDVSGSMSGDRIRKLKEELRAAIEAMPSTTRFNMIPFHSRAYAWSKRLRSADKKSKAAAAAFVDKLNAAGMTNLWDALQIAMRDKEVDTIMILSDGHPTAGKVKDTREIRTWFYKANRGRMILLNVILIGLASPDLKAMAQISGGKYRER
ncbi:MAG: VWA domain-containing protein [Planctomycetota bacterium]